jgi:cytochrome c556
MEPSDMHTQFKARFAAVTLGLFIGGAVVASANAQNAATPSPPAPPSANKQAVENRKAAFTLIGNYFRYFGGVAKGNIPYDEAEATKRAARIAFLAGIVEEAFPEGSNPGEPDSKAKADVWSNRAEFDKKLKAFQADATALVEINGKEKAANDAWKASVAALAQDCKGCHETYKVK